MRTLLPLLAATLTWGCATSPDPTTDHVPTEATRAEMSAHDALRELRDGNDRFAAGKSRRRDFRQQVAATSEAQYPFAAVLTSIDSRVAPEYVFDQGLGDLLVTRVGGMVVGDDILGSLEYACRMGGVKVLVVLGHSDSEAIAVAIDPPDEPMGHMTPMLDDLTPSVESVPDHITPRDAGNPRFVAEANRRHVWHTMSLIRERSPVLREMIVNGDVWMIGAMYDVGTGEVTWLE